MAITIKELRQKSDGELKNILKEEQEQLRKLRFQNTEGKLRRNHRFKASRRTIARTLTLRKEKGE